MDKLYDSVGIECGTAEGQEVIGLMFPEEGPPNLANPDYEIRYMTLPAAKALLIDLRDAIAEFE